MFVQWYVWYVYPSIWYVSGLSGMSLHQSQYQIITNESDILTANLSNNNLLSEIWLHGQIIVGLYNHKRLFGIIS